MRDIKERRTFEKGDVLVRFDLWTVSVEQYCSFSWSANGRRRCLNYNQIRPARGPPGVGSFRDFQPAYCRRSLPFFRQPVHPFCRVSVGTAVHGGGPWYRNLISEHDKARVRTGDPDGSFIINTQDWNNPFLPLNLYRRWNEAIEEENTFHWTYRSQLIGSSKKQYLVGMLAELRLNDTR